MAQTLFDVEPDATDESDLPELTGTEKQVPWATQIRRKLIAEMDATLLQWQRYTQRLADQGDHERSERERENLRQALRAADGIREQTYSGWWIDRRSQTAKELLAGIEPEKTW